MPIGVNVLTIKGPHILLNRIHNTGAKIYWDTSGTLYTYSEMYFGSYIYVLERTKNRMTISYKSPKLLTVYLEQMATKYKGCSFRNEFRNGSITEIWMARFRNGQVVPLQIEPEEVFTDEE